MSVTRGPTRRPRALTTPIAALVLTASACVFPAGSSTGIEISWRFAEQASSLGRARTCDGALVTHVEVQVTDSADDERTLTRRYPCEAGYAAEAPDSLSEAFFDVRPGTYDVSLQAFTGELMTGEAVNERVVLDHGIALMPVELSTQAISAVLSFNHFSDPQLLDCQDLAATLRYEDPARDLDAASDGAAEADTPPEVYGEDLEGHHGLRFNAEPFPCALLGVQLVTLDRGRYTLDLSLEYGDGSSRVCSAPLLVDPGAAMYNENNSNSENTDGGDAVANNLSISVDLDAACATDSLANPVPDR